MTWGKIQLQLTKFWTVASEGQSQPDMDLCEQWLSSSYRAILDSRGWRGLLSEGMLQTTALYDDGTATVTTGSATVTGVGTTWTTAMTGRKFRFLADNTWYYFTYVSATSGTLDRNYEADSQSASGYQIWPGLYTLADDTKYLRAVADPTTLRPLERWSREKLDATDPSRLVVGDPSAWAPGPDTDEDDTDFFHRIELFPIPQNSIGLPITYEKAPNDFTGDNTSASPLAWVSPDAILAGAKARLLRHLRDYNGAAEEQKEFSGYVLLMSNQESRSDAPQAMKMASRFTRHRAMRGMPRGTISSWNNG